MSGQQEVRGRGQRVGVRLVGVLLVGVLLATGVAGGLAQAQNDERCFEATGYCIAGRIRSYWEQNGGLPVFGYPITPQRAELVEGAEVQTQWFERNRLELHPENQPPYDVLLGRLGVVALEQQGRDWPQFPRDGAPQPGCRYFAETGQNVCGAILARWEANGLEFDGQPGASAAESLALFGLPISPAQPEQTASGEFQVQWFERARFEIHPENEPPANVLLGLLGNELYTSTTADGGADSADSADDSDDGSATPDPSASPTRRIAFASNRTGNNDIFVMHGDGSGLVNLTSHPAEDTEPVWSPDGTQIAFISDRDGNPEIYLASIEKPGLFKQLTNIGGINRQPTWSPDGTHIAFASERRGQTNIYRINLFGAGLISLTSAAGVSEAPAWSPDGTLIAFATNRDGGDWEIYLMRADGSNEANITNSSEDDRDPAWAPDSWRIAFASNRESGWDIFTMNADGSDQRNVTRSPDNDGFPAWAPDGARLAFHSLTFAEFQAPNFEILSIAPDGSDLLNLTNNPAEDMSPSWAPAPPLRTPTAP